MFSCGFCENSKNTFFTEHLWTTASIHYDTIKMKRFSDFWDTSFCFLFEKTLMALTQHF